MSGSTVAPAIMRSIRPSARSWGRPSALARCDAKRSSFMRPSSKAISASRVSSSCRKASRSRSGATPSVVQNAPKAANRLVVITPPQSRSRPWWVFASLATGQALRAVGQLDDAVAEGDQVRVVAHPGRRPLEVALHEDDRLPQRERLVPADVAHRAAAALLVAGDELGARRPALVAGHAGQLELADLRVVALDVERAEVAKVGERVADRRHLPVQDGGDVRRGLRREQDVAEAVVAVDDRG